MVPCSISTPSWSHCTCWWTTGGSSTVPRSHRKSVGLPCSATRRSSPCLFSPSGPASEARGTSGASLVRTCALTSPPCAPRASSIGASELSSPSSAPFAAGLRPRALRAFGRLSGDGHDARPGHREGEGFSQGPLLRAGFLLEERLQDRVGLRLQGGLGGGPRRGDHCFRSGTCGLRREAYSRRPPSLRPLRCLPSR